MTEPSIDDFKAGLDAMLDEAKSSGFSKVRVIARDLHHRVAKGFKGNHRMPTACSAMWQKQKGIGGEVIYKTKSGKSSRLEIEFTLIKNRPHRQ